MRISIIVAMDRNGGIGFENRLPWRLSTDLKRFRELTLGHHLVVGRKTFDSIGRPLPGRHMIVLSRDPGYLAAGCQVATSLRAAIQCAREQGEAELFIGGGAEIYAMALPITDRLYLTRVDSNLPVDTLFPSWSREEWTEIERIAHPAGENDQFNFEFIIYERRAKI